MKKIILILILGCFFASTVNATDFNSCKTLYNDQKYNQASFCFYYRVKADGNDVQSRFWYAASLFFDRQYNLAYAQYNYIAQKYPNSEIGRYSKTEAQKVKRKMEDIQKARANDSGTYISSLDKVSKWYSMPLRIWIEPSPYKNTAHNAFLEWQTKTSNAVRFSFVSGENQAQIKVYFKDKISQPMRADSIGLTTLKFIGNMNTSAVIEILKKTDSGQIRTNNQIYPVVLHEIGHALGLSGHSKSNNDILYPNNYTNDIHLSQRDINTIKAIYKK